MWGDNGRTDEAVVAVMIQALDIAVVKRVIIGEGRAWEEGEWGTLGHINVTLLQ